MPKKAGMEKWKKKRRQEYLEMKQYRYYIFCEGQQTEPLYFAAYKKLIEENPVYKDIFKIFLEHGNSKLAIRYAKRIIKDGVGKTPTEIAPGTKVYELVEELAKYLPEEIQEKIK